MFFARPRCRLIQNDPITLGMPALISGCPMRVDGQPTRKSATNAIWNPAPAATPFTAATTGFSTMRMAW